MIATFFKRRVVTDAAWYTVAHVCVQLCSLVGVLLVARYLGPINLGLYSFVQNYLAAFVTILSGIDTYAHWRMIQERYTYSYVVQYIRYKAYIVIPLLILFCVVSYLVLPADLARFIPFLCIPILTSVFASIIFLLQHKNYSRFLAIWMSVSALTILALKVLAVYTNQSLITFIAINSIDGVILTLATAYIFFGEKNKNIGELQNFSFKNLMTYSIFPVLYVCVWYVVVRFDQFLIPYFYNAYTLGLYSSAVKITEMTNVLVVILQSLLLPRIGIVLDSYEQRNKALFVYAGIGVVSAGILSLFAPHIISLLYGEAFAEAGAILRVYAWSIPGLFVTYFFTALFLAKQEYKKLALLTCGVVTASVPLSIFAGMISIQLLALVSVGVYVGIAILLYFKYL